MTSNEVFSKIIQEMTRIAKADGKITEEEEELLIATQVNLMMYDEALDQALEDGIIDQDELELLNGLKEQIIQDAYNIAELSDGISEDELKLLNTLINYARKQEHQ